MLPVHSEEKFGKTRLSMLEPQEKSVLSSPLPQNRFAAELRGFGALGILAVLVIAAGQLVPPLKNGFNFWEPSRRCEHSITLVFGCENRKPCHGSSRNTSDSLSGWALLPWLRGKRILLRDR
jgi:hypothetical protein